MKFTSFLSQNPGARISLACRILLLAALTGMLAGGVNAQNLGLTQDQLNRLQNLTPSQREALLDSLSSQPIAQQQLSQPVEVLPREPVPTISTANAGLERQEVQSESSEQNGGLESQGLEPFGYSLFAGSPTTFAPATNIPVPATYIVGPGDNVIIQLYGQQNVTHDLVVPEERVRPKRTQITLIGGLIGLLFSVFIIFLRRNMLVRHSHEEQASE